MKIFIRYLLIPSIIAIILAINTIYNIYPSKKASSVSVSERNTQDKQIARKDYHKNFIYPSDSIRDPFEKFTPKPIVKSPVIVPEKTTTSVILTGILWHDKNPIAIFKDSNNNSYLAKRGEEIGSIKILDIQRNGVKIRKGGKTEELTLLSKN